jgi:hypothetical protein
VFTESLFGIFPETRKINMSLRIDSMQWVQLIGKLVSITIGTQGYHTSRGNLNLFIQAQQKK